MAFFARRGSTELTIEEIRAHLATLLQLENVSVLLGAGASVGVGGQVVHQLWSRFVTTYLTSVQFLLANNFVGPEHVNPDAAFRKTPNIERLGDSLEIARAEYFRRGDSPAFVASIESVINDVKRCVVQAAALEKDWWTNPSSTSTADKLGSHKSLLQKITSARQPGQSAPWLFTTNYDLAVEWAAEAIDLQVLNGFLGLHNRRFSPQSFDLGLRNAIARGEARFGIYNVYLAKLHGSLTWTEEGGEVFERSAMSCASEIDAFLKSTGGLPRTMVFPRAAKYMETIGFVLGELLRRFSEFLVRPQTALLVSGYGFGDEHLNRILLSALQNPTLQVVVYLPEWDGHTDKNAKCVQTLMSLNSPRVTIVGGAPEAYFDNFVSHLPDPIIYDEQAAKIRELLRVGVAAGAGGAT